MRHSRWFKSLTLMVTLLFMAACGGGGGGTPSVETPTGPTTGIAVDPYIVGAVFLEKTPAGEVVQVSSASDENGRFTFEAALTDGNIIEIDPNNRGLHNGVPFSGTLKRKIDDTGELVTSPLTTLLAEGKSETEVVGILKTAGVEVSEEDLKANPMEKLEGKASTQVTDEDLAVLVATIAVNAALAILDQDVGSDQLATLVQSVATVVKTKVLASDKISSLVQSAPQATVENIVSTAVAVTDAVVETVKNDGGEVEAAAENIDDTVVADSVSSAASGGGSVSLEKDETGTFKPVNHNLRYFLDKGFAALTSASSEGKSAELFAAVDAFQAAGKLADTDTEASANDKDTARFFSALTNVVALAKPYSDSVDNGLNNVGDILDALGVDADRTVFDTIELPQKNCVQATNYDGSPMVDEQNVAVMDCEDDLSKAQLTTGQLQDFMFDKIGGGLKEAIANLDKITEDFNSTEWADPMDNSVTEFDHADALFLKGLAKAMLGQLNFQHAYDFSIDIADTDAKANAEAGYTAEEFFTDNPTLAKLEDAAKMSAAKDYFAGAIDAFKAAIEAMELEADQGVDQEDDFVTFYNVEYDYSVPGYVDTTDEDIAEAKEALDKAKATLDAPLQVEGNDTETTEDDQYLDIYKIFSGIDLREKLPAFSDDRPGLFPDPTFDGIVPEEANLNEDLDGDGAPDLLAGYTQFSDQLLAGKTLQGWGNSSYDVTNPGVYYNFELSIGADGSYLMNASDCDSNGCVNDNASGAWTLSSGQLLLDNGLAMTVEEGEGGEDYLNIRADWTLDGKAGQVNLYWDTHSGLSSVQ